jgi:DUF4097 and DUF4098 domain-containing protein YvlB
MKSDSLIYATAALLCLGALLTPAQTRAAKSRDLNISTGGNASGCSDLHATSRAELAQVNESFTLSKGEAPILEMNAVDRGQIHVRAWDHADYSIETCKIAVADTRGEADQVARGITVSHTAGNISFSGPATETADWRIVFFINAPRDAALNLETKNGPLDVKGINGSVKLRATNGPVAVSDCGGTVNVQTQNGPIAFHGDRGDVRLAAENGPIALHLSADTWNGSLLEARTENGPLAVHMSENFHSGMRLETSGHSPVSCQAAQCRNAWTDSSLGKRTLQINGANESIRLSTNNGPVALASGSEGAKSKLF